MAALGSCIETDLALHMPYWIIAMFEMEGLSYGTRDERQQGTSPRCGKNAPAFRLHFAG
jgi:hypothetical protein